MEGRWTKFLFKDVPIYPLVTFRIVFGLLMIISTVRFIYLGWIPDHFINTLFQFKYFGFEWVPLLPPVWMYAVHIVMVLAALGLMLGFLYRLSVLLLFLTFTFTDLVDLTYYLNHYYLVSLICLILVFIPAHKYYSIDAKLWPSLKSEKTKGWHINLIKFQIFVVYFFAGIAKINEDWLLNALPMKIWLPAHDMVPILGSIFSHSLSPYVFSWMGMFYDTFIVFLLLFKPTRTVAYFVVILFHATVGVLFQIGIFPVVMIGVTLIFFSAEWHKKRIGELKNSAFGLFFGKLLSPRNVIVSPSVLSHLNVNPVVKKNISILLLTGYMIFQMLFPMRYLLYPGNMFWTEEGYRFSWRVMLMEKAGTAIFYVKDTKTGREGIVDNSDFLNTHQEKQMAFQPDMLLQYAHFLGDYYQKKGVTNPEVRVEAWVTLNARPSQLMIEPNLDLMTVKDSWGVKHWIIPLKP